MTTKKFFSVAHPYLIGLLFSGASLGLAFGIFMWLGKPIFVTIFLPAIMVSAWYGGIRAGIFTDIVTSFAIYYVFTAPYHTLGMKSPLTVVGIIFFILEGLIISYFIDSGHRHEKLQLYKSREKEYIKKLEAMEKELAAAKQETALRDEFLAIASHELKTPLTTVVLQIQTTLHNIRNVSLSEFSVEHLLHMLQSMQSQTKRLTKMINDLLNTSLITTHRMELELDDVNLATLIHDVVDDFQEKLEREGQHISVEIKSAIVGKWDKIRLGQVLDNLISNAMKYGNKKPIKIVLEKQRNFAVIRVIDHGIGIKDSEKKNVFTLFKRAETGKDYKGLGIGLYIAQQIISLHGGSIELQSTQGKGSIFTMYLPIRKE